VSSDLDRRRALLTAALGFALLDTKGKPTPPEVETMRTWLDSWQGLGHVVTGMQRQDYDLFTLNRAQDILVGAHDLPDVLGPLPVDAGVVLLDKRPPFAAERNCWLATFVSFWSCVDR
jgi:hypothetical protein